jgi:hypothetical protein
VKKALGWVVVAFLAFYVVTQPADAANLLRSLGDGLRDIATGFGTFVSNVF